MLTQPKNPRSAIANALLGVYCLSRSYSLSTTDELFKEEYIRSVTYTNKAYKLDDRNPLACVSFSNYLLMRKLFDKSEKLARNAIELTDVNAIASDGWYLRARKEHQEENIAAASQYYLRADQARGGEDRGYLPAKFGVAQIKVLQQDFDGAKFRLEKIVQTSKNAEAMTLLGTLYAEDVFAARATKSKEDKSNELKKAISLLETVRGMAMDPKKHVEKDSSILLNLARLYEIDHPDKSLQYLQEVEDMELKRIPESQRPDDIEDEAMIKAFLRESLPPQLLNNMACFYYQNEKYLQARELFQAALSACVKVAADTEEEVDTDALVTSISYNLGRTYEAEGMTDGAKEVYDGLLKRHPDYTDAKIRLAYINLQQHPQDEGPKAVKELVQEEPTDIEVRSLYGYFIRRAKKRTMDAREDQEQRHYKQTLQKYDNHELYSLTGCGNIWLAIAREMRRDTDEEKKKRRYSYGRAVDFYDKALRLDSRNAYAAMGIAIALIEDKRDYTAGVQILTKVKETLKDSTVYINLGHAYAELRQFHRSIEHVSAACIPAQRSMC